MTRLLAAMLSLLCGAVAAAALVDAWPEPAPEPCAHQFCHTKFERSDEGSGPWPSLGLWIGAPFSVAFALVAALSRGQRA